LNNCVFSLVESGDYVVREGEPVAGLCLIWDGQVSLSSLSHLDFIVPLANGDKLMFELLVGYYVCFRLRFLTRTMRMKETVFF
jgi:hypothetical protein